MIDINEISLNFGQRVLFDNASAHISDGQRVGLTGKNGSGKTTLFNIILGTNTHADGEIRITKGHRIASVAQQIPNGNIPLINYVLESDTYRTQLLAELEQAEIESNGEKLAEIHDQLNIIQAYSAEARAATILYGLGFSETDQQKPITDFSGGWRMRVALATALFVPSDILLLDEPTNHLDLEASLWLESFLLKYPGTLLIISHDRILLNHICTHILHIENTKISAYTGNYETFEKTWAIQHENAVNMAKKTEEQRQHLQSYVDRFRYKASKAKQAQSRIKMLEKLPPKEIFTSETISHFNFPSPEKVPSPLIKIENGATGYGQGDILTKLNLRIDSDDRIALLGANGNGKSTFVKLLAGQLNLTSGTLTKSGKTLIGYYAQHQTEQLSENLTPIEQLKTVMPDANETELRSQLGRFGLIKQRAETKIQQLSGGEKARLLFAIMSRSAPHILLLDEPTNHLDIDARDALIEAINAYEGAVILITHDSSLVELTADKLWIVKDKTITNFDGDLEDYKNLLLQNNSFQSTNTKDKKESVSRKDERRDAAEKRKLLAPLKKKVVDLEIRLEKLNDKQAELEQLLEDPSLYMLGMNGNKVKNLRIAITDLENQISETEDQWLTASAELEELTKSLQ